MCLFCVQCGACGKPRSPELEAYYGADPQCLRCGTTVSRGEAVCPACGYEMPKAAGQKTQGVQVGEK